MKQFLFALVLIGSVCTAKAQDATSTPSKGDYFDCWTRPLTCIYLKKLHFQNGILFSRRLSAMSIWLCRSVGCQSGWSGKRSSVKATLRDFSKESNLAVITEDGAYYTFNVKYADEPVKLSIEMTDFIHDGEAVNRPNNAQEIYMRELGSESPLLVKLIMKSILQKMTMIGKLSISDLNVRHPAHAQRNLHA